MAEHKQSTKEWCCRRASTRTREMWFNDGISLSFRKYTAQNFCLFIFFLLLCIQNDKRFMPHALIPLRRVMCLLYSVVQYFRFVSCFFLGVIKYIFQNTVFDRELEGDGAIVRFIFHFVSSHLTPTYYESNTTMKCHFIFRFLKMTKIIVSKCFWNERRQFSIFHICIIIQSIGNNMCFIRNAWICIWKSIQLVQCQCTLF